MKRVDCGGGVTVLIYNGRNEREFVPVLCLIDRTSTHRARIDM
jgi:hypothetical protein